MKFNIYKLSFLLTLVFSQNHSFAQSDKDSDNSKIYANFTIGIDQATCSESINEKEIIAKEFSNTSFKLDLKSNFLSISYPNGDDLKTKKASFSIGDNKKLSFNDQEKYGKLEAYLIFENELPVIKFKDHSDDCFFYVLKFAK